jgi:acyl dehydratase
MSRYWEEFEVGARYPTYGRTITDGDHSLFCALVGYHVPLFIDEEHARKTPFGGRICPSALIMSFSTAQTESLYRMTMIGLVSVDHGKFLQPVRPGDTITTEVEVVSKRPSKSDPTRGVVTFRDHVLNQRGEEVFTIEKTTIVKRKPVASA